MNRSFRFLWEQHMQRSFLFFSLILATFSFLPTVAHACSCVDPPTVEESFKDSIAVVYGTVVSVDNDSDSQFLTLFAVENSWKGVKQNKIIVKSDRTSCGIDLQAGKSYYLWLGQTDNLYITVPCRRHGGSEEDFLKPKPQLLLESVSLELPAFERSAKPRNSSNGNRATQSENPSETKDSFITRDLVLIIGAAVSSAVLVLLAVGIGFFFWTRKR